MRFDAEALGPTGWFFLFFHGLYVPWKAWRSRARLAGAPTLPPRATHFTNTIVMLVLLLPISLAVAYLHHMELYPLAWPHPVGWLLGAFVLAAMLVLMVPRWRTAVDKRDRRLYFFMPHGANEKALWVGVSATAAFVEETTYRGVLFTLLLWTTGEAAIAAVAAAAIFALAHAFQSRLSTAIVFVYGLLFQILALVSGSLYVPMLVHFLYDVAAGFTYSWLGDRDGYPVEGLPLEEASSSGSSRI